MIALLVMTDGRDHCLEATMASASQLLRGPITQYVLYDDTGDPDHRARLAERYPWFEIVAHPEGRQGFGGAIRAAWAWLRRNSDRRFVFHLEDDFEFVREVRLEQLANVLDNQPHVAQLALRRQPVGEAEIRQGGFLHHDPDAFEQHRVGRLAWIEHRRFFTTNPSLYRRRLLLEQDWPAGGQSEGLFTARLLEDPALRFGYWGDAREGEWVHHIGDERKGTGY